MAVCSPLLGFSFPKLFLSFALLFVDVTISLLGNPVDLFLSLILSDTTSCLLFTSLSLFPMNSIYLSE